jgi:D-alanine-D-alanine ligase
MMRADSRKPRSAAKPRTIAVLVDVEVVVPAANGGFELERGSMEWQVKEALERVHAHVSVVPFDPRITPTVDALRRFEPDLVFNLTEWLGGDRRLDAAIAGMLDMMQLAYTGSGPDAMQLARDKALAKRIVADLGVTVAPHTLVNGRAPRAGALTYPVFVKPQYGDGSDEIGNAALVRSGRELERRLASIRRRRADALMCEQFVPGRDLFVALLGNEPRVMPPLELVVGRRGQGAPRFATGRIKNDARYRTRWRVRYRVARVPPAVAERIEDASRRIFHALKLRDYARIDYRLTPAGELVFLEANPNPDLTRHTFGRDRCFAGVGYAELISTIVDSAFARRRKDA